MSGEPVSTPRGHRRRRRLRLGTGLVAVALAVPTGASYASALTSPGAGPWDVASVAWLDDHGLAPVVNAVETWKYSRDAPAASAAVTPADLPGRHVVPASHRSSTPASIPVTVPGPPLPGEGQWSPAGQAVDGGPTAWTTFFRPDPSHTGVLSGALRIDQSRTVTTLVPGLGEPGPVSGALPSSVPTDLRSSLVATINAGYKVRDDPGGFFLAGQAMRPLTDGRASLVIGSDGRVDVRAWSGGPVPGPDVAAVRQNLAPVVEGGQPVAGLTDNTDRAWGKAGQQNQYTTRTGAGVTANGDLVVVEGGAMRLDTLAETLVEAGAVTGMQLEIHTKQVSVDTFLPDPASLSGVQASPVLPDQKRSADRYLSPDQRDFLAVFTRGTTLPGVPA